MKRRKQQKREVPEVKYVEAKTENQKDYIRAIAEHDVVFCSGPAGCGKSYIAAGMAAQYLHQEKVSQIVVTRPLVCAGKDIGALPGEVHEKINPYITPMEENLKHFLGRGFYGHYANDRKIRYEPLEVMRGTTFHETCMILDEAQNCTLDQIKMFITRMGEGSKVLINGDIKQTDIRGKSGLERCMWNLDDVDGVAIVELTYADIQRNGIIGRILEALEE